MEGNVYQKNAMRTNDGLSTDRLLHEISSKEKEDIGAFDIGGILNAALGLSGETGELNDMLKKWIFHEKELDIIHFKKEIGDVLWYIALMCESCNFNINEIMEMNIDKLKGRYPEGFDPDKSNNRKEGDV